MNTLDRSVLVVDDDPVHRNIVFHILRAAGYRVESCADAVDAIEALRWKKYSVIVLDLMMEVYGGEKLLDYVEQNLPALTSRVIVLTGMPDARTVLAGRPVFEIIEKPFKQRDLLVSVNRCLEQSPADGIQPST